MNKKILKATVLLLAVQGLAACSNQFSSLTDSTKSGIEEKQVKRVKVRINAESGISNEDLESAKSGFSIKAETTTEVTKNTADRAEITIQRIYPSKTNPMSEEMGLEGKNFSKGFEANPGDKINITIKLFKNGDLIGSGNSSVTIADTNIDLVIPIKGKVIVEKKEITENVITVIPEVEQVVIKDAPTLRFLPDNNEPEVTPSPSPAPSNSTPSQNINGSIDES